MNGITSLRLLAKQNTPLVNSSLRFRHCAILFKNSNLISIGRNKKTLPSFLKEIDLILGANKLFYTKNGVGFIHAEVDAILKAGLNQKKSRGSTCFVYGESRAGNLLNSKPCRRCMIILNHFGIKRIIYSNKDGSFTLTNL